MEEFDGIARVLASGVAERLDGQPRAGRCKIPKSKCRRGRRGPWLHQIVLLGSGGRRLRDGRTVFPAHQMETGLPVVCEHFFRTIVSQMLVATKKKKIPELKPYLFCKSLSNRGDNTDDHLAHGNPTM